MAFKYQSTLNAVIAILLVVAVGFVAVWTHTMEREYIKQLNLFVFKFALPALVIRGLGLKIDLYNTATWRVVGAFVLLRAFTLVGSVITACITKGGPGHVVVHWMASTWVSSIILGVPILAATLGLQYAQLGLLAGISSFIFQLPLMLLLLEAHRWRGDQHKTPQGAMSSPTGLERRAEDDGGTPLAVDTSLPHSWTPPPPTSLPYVSTAPPSTSLPYVSTAPPSTSLPNASAGSASTSLPHAVGSADFQTPGAEAASLPHAVGSTGHNGLTRQLRNGFAGRFGNGDASSSHTVGSTEHHGFSWRLRNAGHHTGDARWLQDAAYLGKRLLRNNVLWGIAIGFALSLSTLGPKYLDPGNLPAKPNCRAVPGLAWVDQTLESLGQCTTPVALFATGMWLCSQQALGKAADLAKAVVYLLVKLVVVPAVMVGCCILCKLDKPTARGSVLIAALPISEAAFAVTQEFGIGADIMAKQVTLQTLLLLPTVIAWLAFMDGVGLFTSAAPAGLVNPCRKP